jgi:hypothetical protein
MRALVAEASDPANRSAQGEPETPLKVRNAFRERSFALFVRLQV